MRTSDYVDSHDGTSIWYGTLGEGPVMVLCDGFACDGFIWAHIMDYFCEDYTLVRWHYRGHGRSGTPEDLARLDVSDLVADLGAVLGALGDREVILVGHSMGAQVLLQAWAEFPERIRALVPICGTFKRPLETFGGSDWLERALPYIESLATTAPGALQSVWNLVARSELTYLMSHVTELNANLVTGADFRPYLEHISRMDVQVYVGMLKLLAEHSAEEILGTVEVPTLVIASEFDTFTPMSRSEEMVRLLPDAELVVLPGASHAGPIELPETVIGAMEKFLNRLP
jgi:pimeloyl-ACP methyl ester carboxylesterase